MKSPANHDVGRAKPNALSLRVGCYRSLYEDVLPGSPTAPGSAGCVPRGPTASALPLTPLHRVFGIHGTTSGPLIVTHWIFSFRFGSNRPHHPHCARGSGCWNWRCLQLVPGTSTCPIGGAKEQSSGEEEDEGGSGVKMAQDEAQLRVIHDGHATKGLCSNWMTLYSNHHYSSSVSFCSTLSWG